MSAAFRSVLVVNRSSLLGTAIILALSAALLTVNGAWLEAGIRHGDLATLVGIASSFAGTVVLITVFIVASVFAGALRQRLREFALLRAVGATTAQIRRSVTAEAIVLLLMSTPIGGLIGFVVAPLVAPLLESAGVIPPGFSLPLYPLAFAAALVVVVPTGLLAARNASRGILSVSPTEAVRESTLDPKGISRGRLLTAGGVAVAGVLAAAAPFFAPGTLGAASGAVSGILFVVAAALAGPVLVHWMAVRGAKLGGNGASRTLALANARGFSRRLSAAIIPLALLVALGSVQSGVDTGISSASAKDLREGIQTDLIVQSTSGITAEQADAIAALPGVAAVTTTTRVAASARTEADEDGDGSWEQISLLSVSQGNLLIDPAVQSGSLDDLDGADTVAVSGDALPFSGKGVGDTVDLQLEGGETVTATIAAVYDRGLGFGDYIIGAGLDRAVASAPIDTVFVDSPSEARADTQAAIEALGLTAMDRDGYALAATTAAGGEQRLSLVLLLALLGFVAAAAANTLVAATRSRRPEFTLLMRLGTTRSQIMRMVSLEAAFIIVTALAVGVLAVLPALTGVGQGLLGVLVPVFDVPVLTGLVITAVLVTLLTVIPAAWIATSAGPVKRA